ncbi:MAG: hypothetical protein ACI86S_001281 [Paracoccaceae bacterium]
MIIGRFVSRQKVVGHVHARLFLIGRNYGRGRGGVKAPKRENKCTRTADGQGDPLC